MPNRLSIKIQEIFSNMFGDVSRDTNRNLSVYTRRSTVSRKSAEYNWGRTDYAYWRRAYYGKVLGLEISGLFIRPIINKISAWVLGRPPYIKCKTRASQSALDEWWDQNHNQIMKAYRSALKQADSVVVINSDLSLTILPPDCIDPIVSEQNFGEKIGWRITQTFPHPERPSRKMKIIDEYYEDRRVHREIDEFGNESSTVFPNIIGRIPVVVIANQPEDNEEFGHPEAEALVDLFHRYGQVIEASVEGNMLQGRPTPVISFETLQDLNAFWKKYGNSQTITLPDGTQQTTQTLSLDLSEVLTISGAKFSYESPGTFVEDTERLLGLLFYLALEHIEIPEFVLGNAIQGSKASAETQMPVFEMFIRMKQTDCVKWITNIASIVLSYLAVMKPGVQVEEPIIQWAKLTQNGRLTLDSVTWGYGEGLIDERTALLLLPIDLEKPDEVLRQARKDADKRHKEALKKAEEQIKVLPQDPAQSNNDMDPELQLDLESLNI